MVATNADASKAYELYTRLEQNAPDAWLDGKPWIDTALTQALLLLAGEDVIYAQVDLDANPATGRLVLFTETSLLIAAQAESGPGAVTTLMPRSAIESLEIMGGDPVIYEPSNSNLRWEVRNWPGSLGVSVTYRGLSSPVQLNGRGINPADAKEPGEIVKFLAELKRDLTGITPSPAGEGS